MTIPIAGARSRAESLMTSTCTIRARSAGSTTDPDTFEVVPTPGTVIYSGKCRVRSPGGVVDAGSGNGAPIGGAETFTYNLIVSVPFSVGGVTAGSEVTIDTSPDPSLAGVKAEVARVHHHENGTARRLYCQEAT